MIARIVELKAIDGAVAFSGRQSLRIRYPEDLAWNLSAASLPNTPSQLLFP